MSFGGEQGAGSGGSLVGAIVGGVIGTIIAPGAGTLLGISLGSTIGGIAGYLISPPKSPEQSPPSGISDLYITSASLGTLIPIVHGAFRIPGNIIDATKKQSTILETETPGTGGMKGKGGGNITSERFYFITLDIALCEGPIQRIARIWADLDLWYDESADLGKIELTQVTSEHILYTGVFLDDETPVAVDTVTLYFGREDAEEVDPTFEEIRGVGTTPIYRGTAHIVFKDLALGNSGRVPNFTFEVVKDGTYLDSLQDLDVSNAGVYALYARSIGSKRSISFSIEVNVTVDNVANTSTLERVDGGSFSEDGFALGDVSIAGSPAGNNGRWSIFSVTTSLLVLAGLMEAENPGTTLILTQSVREPNASGVLRSYTRRTVSLIAEQSVGVNPQVIAIDNNAGTGGDTVSVLNYGSLDGLDPSTDTLNYFFGGVNLESPLEDTTFALRTGGEISSNTVLQSRMSKSQQNGKLFVSHDSVPAITRFTLTGSTRATIGGIAVAMVTDRPNDRLYVLLDSTDSVEKYNTLPGGGMTLIETITLPSGASVGRMIIDTNEQVWVSNLYDATVTYFTTDANKTDISVLNAPLGLVEASDGFIWVSSSSEGAIDRIDPSDDSVESFTLPLSVPLLTNGVSGKIWGATIGLSSVLYLIDTDGTYTQVRVPPGVTKIISDDEGYCYLMCVDSRTIFVVDPTASATTLLVSEAGLACVVRYYCERAGIPGNQVDVSLLDNTPVNMVLSEVQSARNVIQQLADTFLFSAVESEGVLKFFFQSSVSLVASITEECLSGGVDKQDVRSLAIARTQEIELPTQITITAPDLTRNYQDSALVRQITSGRAGQNPQVIRLPLAMTYQQANKLAETHLLTPWTRRERGEFTLSPVFSLLEPGDGITLTARALTYTMRLTEKNSGRSWLDSFKSEAFDSLVFENVEEVAIPEEIVPRVIPTSTATSLLLDLPPLNSTTLTLRFFPAFYKLIADRVYRSATLFQSLDAGVSYTSLVSSQDQATVGTVALALAAPPSVHVWDDTNTITVVMLNGTLETVSELDVLNGANRIALGTGNNCEIIHFMTATLIAANTYTLSHLIRGRKGTESLIGTHGTNEFLILLNAAITNRSVDYSINIVNMSETYKTVTAALAINDTPSSNFTLRGVSLKPWAPVLRSLSRNTPSADDITFNFIGRSRLNDVPIGVTAQWDVDSTKTFNVYIYQDGTYVTLKRTIQVVATGALSDTISAVYTSANQTTDFGSPQSTVYYGVLENGVIMGYESRSSG